MIRLRLIIAQQLEPSRFDAQHQATSPLLGREVLDLLMRRWEEAKRGECRVVLLTGKPGIGKSRIARAVRDRIGSDPHTLLSCLCSPHHQNSALSHAVLKLIDPRAPCAPRRRLRGRLP
jgi:predicted ATPase